MTSASKHEKTRSDFELMIVERANRSKYRFMDQLLKRLDVQGDYATTSVNDAWLGWCSALDYSAAETLNDYFELLAKAEKSDESLELGHKQSQMVERLFWEFWDDAFNENAMLLMDVGYNRVSNWVVAVWDSSGVGIKDARKVAYTDGLYSRHESLLVAAKQLTGYLERKRVLS